MAVDLRRLQEFDQAIQEIARDFGLDFYPQEFDVVPAEKMLEIMAYNFPANFSHWSFGRDFERQRTSYEHGFGLPYEVVLNSNPCRAYLMRTNPFPVQVVVMAHVYAHNDFMKNNIHFQMSRRDMIPSASDATSRFRGYEEDYGLEEVERVIDAGLAISYNINPDFFITEETEEEKKERLFAPRKIPEKPSPFEDLFSRPKKKRPSKLEIARKTPPEPERDLMLYIINHSPKPLEEWQKDILSTIRVQSRYFWPNMRTKIMNEGWSTLWHQRIITRLFREGMLSAQDHGYYNLYNSRVLAFNRRGINPYLVGLIIFENIEDRWNKGRFGKAFEQCKDRIEKETWDQKLGQGKEKMFEVRRRFIDRFFLEEFLTEELVDKLDLYLYQEQDKGDYIEEVIIEDDWRVIKEELVRYLAGHGIPMIMVEDGDYQGARGLYLKHYFEGVPLDKEYKEKTMEYIYYLWGSPVYLETYEVESRQKKEKIYCYDGKNHR